MSALAVVGLGLLPLATLGPAAVRWLREQQAVAHATRLAAEAVELAALDHPSAPLALAQRSPQPPLRFCWAPPPDADGSACAPGNRLAVVGPLLPAAGEPAPARSLRMIVLWVRP